MISLNLNSETPRACALDLSVFASWCAVSMFQGSQTTYGIYLRERHAVNDFPSLYPFHPQDGNPYKREFNHYCVSVSGTEPDFRSITPAQFEGWMDT